MAYFPFTFPAVFGQNPGTVVAASQRVLFGGTGSANSGTMGATLQTATASTVGVQTQSGTVAATLTPSVGSLSGGQDFPATLAAALQTVLSTGAGTQTQTGTMGLTVTPATADMVGDMFVLGILATLQPALAEMHGGQTQSGTIAAAITIASASITGTSIFNEGTLGASLQLVTYSSTGASLLTGSMGPRLQRVTADMAGLEHAIGAMSVTLQRLVIQGLLHLDVFSTGTVLTLKGLTNPIPGIDFGIDYMPGVLQGRFSNPPYTRMTVPYPASTAADSINVGVANLNNALRMVSGPIIVLAHSQGAQVCSRWMRTYAADGTAPGADRLMFILIGNPLRATGGSGLGVPEFGGGNGLPTPTGTPWSIIDLARRYDGWADPPNVNVPIAVQNASKFGSYHTHYEGVDAYSSAHSKWVIGNTTFLLTQEDPQMLANMALPAAVKLAVKQKIETGYTPPTRPAGEPPIIVPPPSSFWGMVLRFLGIT